MYEETLLSQVELRKDVQLEGVTLGVIARKLDEDEWELFIENEFGVRSIWIETFPSAQTALSAGIKAIESEGAGSFADRKDGGHQTKD